MGGRDTGAGAALERAQRDLLELIAEGATPLDGVVAAVVRAAERLLPGACVAGHVVARGRLGRAAAPGLSRAYLDEIERPESACARAAAHGARIVVTEHDNDRDRARFLACAARFGVRPCWAEPVRDAEGHVAAPLSFHLRHGGRHARPRRRPAFSPC
jgi:hypothetical protein